MIANFRLAICGLVLLGGAAWVQAASPGVEPGWVPVVVARGEYREYIESTPMEQRPYRPLHFYGNAVRREHYRGNPLPTPRDVVGAAQALLRSAW